MDHPADTSDIQQLFEKATKSGGFEYLYVLVRIDGIQCYDGYKDELASLRDWLKKPDTTDPLKHYRLLTELAEPLELLQNLLNVANGKHYQVRAFMHLKKGQGLNSKWPTLWEKIQALIDDATVSGFPALAGQLAAAYRRELLDDNQPPDSSAVEAAFQNLSEFLRDLLRCYFSERLEIAKGPKYIKLPRCLDVLELVSDEEFGLSGLRVHFSQNCTAEFIRSPQGVVATNLEFGPPVTFLMMSVGPSSNMRLVNGKRLHEIGLPGRYNKLGEWKPLIYPGKSDGLVKEAAAVSTDPDVQGTFLYMLLTGHRCIEFVLRTNLEMPGPFTGTEGEQLYIWKCPTDDSEVTNRSVRIYDGWIDLHGFGVEDIERGLAGIGYFVNVLCFPFGAAYSWRIKYRTTYSNASLLTPSHEDCTVVDSIIKKFTNKPDAPVVAAAIDWYNRGTVSTNVFNSFLCYYIALESVAVAIADGSELGPLHPEKKKTKQEKQEQTIACIQAKHEKLFAAEPIRFVNESYFECVQSLTAKTKAGTYAIFGSGHRYLKSLFEESSGGDKALKDLRSELAHGDATLMDKGHEDLIRKHLHEMASISREFLLRVLFGLQPADKPPSWSGAFQQSFVAADPRTTMVASDERLLAKDAKWKIRPEWCE